MALDEHRSKFKVCQWQHQDPAATKAKNSINGHADHETDSDGKTLRRTDTEADQDKLEAYFEAYEDSNGTRKRVETDALEVWFMGAHGKQFQYSNHYRSWSDADWK